MIVKDRENFKWLKPTLTISIEPSMWLPDLAEGSILVDSQG